MKLKILHISDLHYGKKKEDINKVMNAFLKDVRDYDIDMVVFSGDLVVAGTEENFKNVKLNFIDRLVSELKVPINNIHISPGNHDIDRNIIKKPNLDFDYRNQIDTPEKINEIIIDQDEMQNIMYYSRLEKFNKFKDGLNQEYRFRDKLSSTSINNIKDRKIGISCFSTVLFCKGNDNKLNDYGNLIFGETQISRNINHLRECDIKIATFHHDLKNLKMIEQKEIQRMLYSNYDIVLMGHYHDEKIEENKINKQSMILSYAGSLYFREKFFNGYSIIEVDKDNNGKICFKNYIPNEEKFGITNKLIYGGEIPFKIEPKENASGINLKVYNMTEIIANDKLLNKSEKNLADKNIFDMFVEPNIYKKIEEVQDGKIRNKKEKIELSKIINDKENYFIIGKQESGKTTLVNYMILDILRNKIFDEKIPIYFKEKKLQKSKIKLEIIIRNYLNDLGFFDIELPEIKESLAKGKYIIFIDNLNLENLNNLNQMIKNWDNNKFVITIQEKYGDVNNQLEGEISKIEETPNIVYIDFFNSEKVEALVGKWSNKNETQKKQVREVIKSIDKMGIPKTPQIISLMLWISNEQQLYNITNKAVLLEKFFDIILEKLKLKKEFKIMDYADKIHYLSFIAKKMQENNVRSFSWNKLESETNSYLESLSLREKDVASADLIRYFLDKGIFFEADKNYSFKYQSFYEYFIARKMTEDISYRNKILNEWDFIKFPEEIEYYSGIKRTDKELLEFLLDKLESGNNFFNNNNEIKLDTYDLSIKNFLLGKNEFEDEFYLNEENKGHMLEEEKECIRRGDECSSTNDKLIQSDYKYFICLQLLTNTFRNSNQIEDKEFRQKIFEKLIEIYAFLILNIDKETLKRINEKYITNENNKEQKEKYLDIVRFFCTSTITEFMIENIISDRIETFLLNIMDKKTKLENFLLQMLFLDLHSETSIQKVLEYIELEDNKLFIEITKMKVIEYLHIKKCTEKEMENIRKILNLIFKKSVYFNSLEKFQKNIVNGQISHHVEKIIRGA